MGKIKWRIFNRGVFDMRRKIVPALTLILALVLIIMAADSAVAAETVPNFQTDSSLPQDVISRDAPADNPSAWARSEVTAAIEAGLVPESLQKNYQGVVTRAAVANMFINLVEQVSGAPIDQFMAKKGIETAPSAFIDTADPAVLAASALGIIHGKSDGVFDPDGTLLRSEIVTAVCRAAHVLGVDTTGYGNTQFQDMIGHCAEAEIGWPVHMGIIRGISATRFDPDGTLTTEGAIIVTLRTFEALLSEPSPVKISISDPLSAGRKLPILMYHAIADVPTTSLTSLFVRPSELEAQLQYIADNGYQTITFEDLDNIGAFSKPIMLTFDDGYKDNYDILFPLLKKYNLKATIFVIADAVWGRNSLSIENITEMSQSGLVSFQSHTKSHPSLTSLGRDQLVREFAESKAFIEGITGKPVTALAYPSGSVNAAVRSAAAEYYSYAVLNTGGKFTCGDNLLMMNRVRISRGLSISAFASLIT